MNRTVTSKPSSADRAEATTQDVDPALGLSGRSQAMGAVLCVLLAVLVACLLGLLLYKRERRALVIQKVAACCRRGNQVSYKYSKVDMDDQGGQDEMEWLMEEQDPPPTSSSDPASSSRHGAGRGGANGHITAKPVNGLRSLAFGGGGAGGTEELDDDDSEDEVLSVPGVRVFKAPPPSSAPLSAALRSVFMQEESDEDLVGLLDDSDGKRDSRGSSSSRAYHPGPPAPVDLNPVQGRRQDDDDDDDSDEDLLRV